MGHRYLLCSIRPYSDEKCTFYNAATTRYISLLHDKGYMYKIHLTGPKADIFQFSIILNYAKPDIFHFNLTQFLLCLIRPYTDIFHFNITHLHHVYRYLLNTTKQ